MNPAVAGPDAADAPVRCSHCGLDVPSGLMREGSELQFCCNGCASVYEILHGCGLERFYEVRKKSDAEPQAAVTTGRGYEELDDPAFLSTYARARGDGLLEAELYLEGVHCAACVWLVERVPRVVGGVVESRLNLGRSMVTLVWDPTRAGLSSAAAALDRLGYPAHPARGEDARRLRQREDRGALVGLGVAGAIAGNVMLVDVSRYAGWATGMDESIRVLFLWVAAVLGLLSLAWPGRVFFRGALAAARSRTVNLDVPIALALAAGGIGGLVGTVLGRDDTYFDSITILVFLLLVGRYIQRRQQRSSADAVELLYALTPTRARRLEPDGSVKDVPIEALRVGDVVELRAEESAPIDGVVVEGESDVDTSVLTGESRPVRACVGDAVAAGSVNLTAPVRVRVEAVGSATRIGRLMEMVERCSRERSPVVQLADRIAGWFLLVVITLAAVTVVSWWPRGWGLAMEYTVALLIVTCPCALGLATPLAMTVAIGRAARRGILVKGGEAFEHLARPGTMLLDKTGTLTEGKQSLVRWDACEGGPDEEETKRLVRALEAMSSHPIARALVSGLEAGDATARGEGEERGPIATDVQQRTGSGISGVVGGRRVIVGSARFVLGTDASDGAGVWARAAVERAARSGLSPVVVSVDGEARAVASVGDAVRADAARTLRVLREQGWDLAIVSGDHAGVVDAVADALGMEERHGGVSPEGKLALVEEKLALGRSVVVVGDGVNDAAALARATVGVAVRGGAEASLAAADVYLREEGLAGLVELTRAAKRTLRVVRRNLIVSLGYNVIAAGLAVTGVINSLIAAIMMPISSLSVVSMTVQSKTFDRKDQA